MIMSKYVIKNRDNNNKYVSKPGSEKSFTAYLQNAQIFNSKEDAIKNMCPGNEFIEELIL